MVDRPAHRRLGAPSAALRRWYEGTRPKRPTPGWTETPSSADLIADIVVMTGQAVEDGLPLSAVLDDLRLVLHLGPADALPVDALRACAVEWGRVSQGTHTGRANVPVTLDDLESYLWGLLGSSPDQLPRRALVVELAPPESGDEVTWSRSSGVLGQADLLAAAALLVSDLLPEPDEHVAQLRAPPAAGPDRLVALLRGSGENDGQDLLALCHATLASAPVTGAARWAVELHELDRHPSGLLASIREALGDQV